MCLQHQAQSAAVTGALLVVFPGCPILGHQGGLAEKNRLQTVAPSGRARPSVPSLRGPQIKLSWQVLSTGHHGKENTQGRKRPVAWTRSQMDRGQVRCTGRPLARATCQAEQTTLPLPLQAPVPSPQPGVLHTHGPTHHPQAAPRRREEAKGPRTRH